MSVHYMCEYPLCVCVWLGLTQLELGSSPRRFKAAETSWEAGRSALDFTLVLFNGPAQIKLHNTPYLCYSGYGKPYSSFPEGLEKASGVIRADGIVDGLKMALHHHMFVSCDDAIRQKTMGYTDLTERCR